ncbi:MAG: hypothetical protein LUD69_07830 [Oscillospiraceae bacterium]|nr:hypothetical protein [Oscillospiraceae bacterium]
MDACAIELKREIRQIRREPNSIQSKRRIRRLYAELDNVQYKPDYLCVVMDRPSDYRRAVKGFSVNGIRYKRLLGTAGGIKNSTIVFVSDRLVDELRRRIDDGRDMAQAFVPAKLEAYKALTCSASTPVSAPNGVLVVNDCETSFVSEVMYLTDEGDGEPAMEYRDAQEITLDASDGCGMIHPSLAQRWSDELGLGYLASGLNTRMAWEKGVVFTFDFVDFAERVAGTYLVKDAWGDEVDVRNVDLVLTTSMVKLWDSYESCQDYLEKSYANGYTFGITKVCPEELENERTLNYQFIQPFSLYDDDIEELIAPTMNEVKDVLGGDWRKTVLFLKGSGLKEERAARFEDDIAKAIMINPQMVDDPYVQNAVYQAIKKRIDEAKIGVLKVHGNYSIVSGDLYALCQSMFGLEVTGLLGAGEVYNRYWLDCKAENLVCFRAPMSCPNNIRLVHPSASDEAAYWFRYMRTCTVFNGWDTAMVALNGLD